jgi:hypothetical protein
MCSQKTKKMEVLMDAQEGVIFLLRLNQAGKADRDDLEKAIQLAGSNSPARAIKEAKLYYRTKYGGEWDALSFGKGVRWLAIIRRGEGAAAFQKKAAELKESFT